MSKRVSNKSHGGGARSIPKSRPQAIRRHSPLLAAVNSSPVTEVLTPPKTRVSWISKAKHFVTRAFRQQARGSA